MLLKVMHLKENSFIYLSPPHTLLGFLLLDFSIVLDKNKPNFSFCLIAVWIIFNECAICWFSGVPSWGRQDCSLVFTNSTVVLILP